VSNVVAIAGGGNYGLAIVAPPSASVKPELQNVKVLPDHTVQFDVVAQSARTYLVQTSTNLRDWITISNLSTTTSTTTVRDADAVGFKKRFYRVANP
jgi:hypothetical protein